jgi:hypothetical protein
LLLLQAIFTVRQNRLLRKYRFLFQLFAKDVAMKQRENMSEMVQKDAKKPKQKLVK